MRNLTPIDRTTRRDGFTLIELFVVIAIISALIGILVYAASEFIGPAKAKATKATIAKVDGMLQERLRAFDRAFQENRANRFKIPLSIEEDYGLSSRAPDRKAVARALVRKSLMAQYFPVTFAELKLTPPAGHDPSTESSEVMYYLLTTRDDSIGFRPVDRDSFTQAEVADTDNDGFPEFVDAWGSPLRFYRWPTRVVRPDGLNINTALAGLLMTDVGPDELRRDPNDPTNVLPTSLASMGLTAATFEQRYHTLSTFHAPLIVSPGEDLELGLREPQDYANYGHLARPSDAVLVAIGGGGDPGDTAVGDNLTNRQTEGEAK